MAISKNIGSTNLYVFAVSFPPRSSMLNAVPPASESAAAAGCEQASVSPIAATKYAMHTDGCSAAKYRARTFAPCSILFLSATRFYKKVKRQFCKSFKTAAYNAHKK